MTGTARGTIDCQHSETLDHRRAQECFVNLYALLNAHPNLTRKALYYGDTDPSTGADGNGTGYWDAVSNSFGEGAFAVFTWGTTASRTWTYDMLIQLNTGTNPANANPMLVFGGSPSTGTGYVAVSVAVGVGGDLDPWNGTTADDGTDSKSSPVWDVPGGGGTSVIVLPASNATDGTDGTNRENMGGISFTGGTVDTVSIIADDDVLVMMKDTSSDNDIDSVTIIAPFVPTGAITWSNPLVFFSGGATAFPDTTAQTRDNAGISMNDANVAIGQEAKSLEYGTLPFLLSDEVPGEISGAQIDGPIFIGSDEAGARELAGTMFDSVTCSRNLTGVNTNLALTRVLFASNSPNNRVLVAPWDGVTVPGTTGTRGGVTF